MLLAERPAIGLLVECVGPEDTYGIVAQRISQFIRNGIPEVWLVDSDARLLTVYRPGKPMEIVEEFESVPDTPAASTVRLQVCELLVTASKEPYS